MDKTTKILEGKSNIPIKARDSCSFIKLRAIRLEDNITPIDMTYDESKLPRATGESLTLQ